jgi:soluble lytic murein transglycosylase-like protein
MAETQSASPRASGGYPIPGASPKAVEQEAYPYAGLIRHAANEYDLDEALLRSVVEAESNYNPQAVSRVGAQGLMQLMPATAASLGVTDSFDPEQNIMGGAKYLKRLLDRYRGNQELALAAYNWGPGNLERRPHAMPRETKNYITKISQLMRTHGSELV